MSDWKFEITPEMIYGKSPVVPDGYEVVDFKPPQTGEEFLNHHCQASTCQPNCFLAWNPRLIIQKKKPRRWVYEECSKEEASAETEGYWKRSSAGAVFRGTGGLSMGQAYVREVPE